MIDGLTFDSEREARRWGELKAELAAGRISHLRRQERLRCVVLGQLVCVYVADFTYIRRGTKVVEDVKSAFTAKFPVYRLKKKLIRACLGIEIVQVIT